MKKVGAVVLAVLAIIVAVSLALPGPVNPPVEKDLSWDSPETETLFRRACADCHSHETRWPWYAKVPPTSWMVKHHVKEGRREFNISIPDHGEVHEAPEQIHEGKMPIKGYLLTHPEARLSPGEKTALVDGLKKTFSLSDRPHEEHEDDDD